MLYISRGICYVRIHVTRTLPSIRAIVGFLLNIQRKENASLYSNCKLLKLHCTGGIDARINSDFADPRNQFLWHEESAMSAGAIEMEEIL